MQALPLPKLVKEALAFVRRRVDEAVQQVGGDWGGYPEVESIGTYSAQARQGGVREAAGGRGRAAGQSHPRAFVIEVHELIKGLYYVNLPPQ